MKKYKQSSEQREKIIQKNRRDRTIKREYQELRKKGHTQFSAWDVLAERYCLAFATIGLITGKREKK